MRRQASPLVGWQNKRCRVQSADSTLFFWLQEPEKDKDGELLLRCNKAIHGKAWQPPGQAGSSAAAGAATTGATRASWCACTCSSGGSKWRSNSSQSELVAVRSDPCLAELAHDKSSSRAPACSSLFLVIAMLFGRSFAPVNVAAQCRQLLQHMQEDSLCFEDVLDPATIETLVSQPGVPERLLDMLPDGQQNAVRTCASPGFPSRCGGNTLLGSLRLCMTLLQVYRFVSLFSSLHP